MYHDIENEIPPDSQGVVLNVYRLWLLLVVTLMVNVITCGVLLLSNFGLIFLITSIIYLVVIGSASFMLWYRPVYNGLMKEHSLFYYIFFLFCGFHLLFSIYAVIGMGSGCAGISVVVSEFGNGHIAGGVLALVTTIGFLVQGLGIAWYYRILWRHNREKGHSFSQAKAELASHGARAYFTRGSQV